MAVGAVSTIVVAGGGAVAVSLGAVVGGLLTALAVYALAYKRGLHAARLVLVGIGIGVAASAVNNYVLTGASIEDAARATVWLNRLAERSGMGPCRGGGAGRVCRVRVWPDRATAHAVTRSGHRAGRLRRCADGRRRRPCRPHGVRADRTPLGTATAIIELGVLDAVALMLDGPIRIAVEIPRTVG